MVARPLVAAALAVAATLALAGCSNYQGEATGEIGDTLSFPTERNSANDMELAVLDFEEVSSSDAEEWDLDADGGDVYFMHYSANGSTESVGPTEWVVVDGSDESFPARVSFFSSLPDEADCADHPDEGYPCVVFVVPGGTDVTSIRYTGVYTGERSSKGGYNHDEWVAWSIE